VQGGSKNEIYKAADAMGRLVLVDGKRWLRFSPTDAAFGKNPGQLDPLLVPHFSEPAFGGFLAWVIQQTKDRLNELSEAQKATLAEQQWFGEALPKVGDVDGINALIGRATKSGQACKAMLAARAKALGLIFDKKQAAYIEAPKEKAAA
jgi:hypothetical protein